MALSVSVDHNRPQVGKSSGNPKITLIDHMTPALLSGARQTYLKEQRQGVPRCAMTDQENAEANDCIMYVQEYGKALSKPWFMTQRILERDCPIHTRWCSAREAESAAKFVERTVSDALKSKHVGKRKRDVDPFDVVKDIEIVFPTVPTMDTFQMLNNLHSFKEDNVQWSGSSEIFLKMWSELDPHIFLVFIAIKHFIDKFQDFDEAANLLDDMTVLEQRYKDGVGAGDDDRMREKLDESLRLRVNSIKDTLYDTWYKRIQDAVRSLGNIRPAISDMLQYTLCLGIIPYRDVPACSKNDDRQKQWLQSRREVIDRHSVIIVRNNRTNGLSGWDYVHDRDVKIRKIDGQLPFDTKVKQLLKAEYTYSDMTHVQNSILSAPGHIVVEEKDLTEDEASGYAAIGDKAAKEARDRDEAEAWKRQLADADDRVKYYETIKDGDKSRIVLSGVVRPPHYPYMKASTFGKRGSKSADDELVDKLKDELSSHTKHINDLRRELLKDMVVENKALYRAGKRVDEVNSSCANALKKLDKSMNAINIQIERRTERMLNDDDEGGGGGAVGLAPLKDLLKMTDEGVTTMGSMIKIMENQMTDMGINVNSETVEGTFQDYEKRVNVVVNSSAQDTLDVTKNLFDGMVTLLNKTEKLVSVTTSSLGGAAGSAEERAGVANAVFTVDTHNDDSNDIPFMSRGDQYRDVYDAGVNDEIYANYLDSMRKSKEAFTSLKTNYAQIVRQFEKFQEANLQKIMDADVTKAKLVDTKRYMQAYKDALKTQLKVNQELLAKIGRTLEKLEMQVTKQNVAKMKRDAKADRNLESISTDLQQIMATLDSKMTGGEFKSVFDESSALMKMLQTMRESKAETLQNVIDTYDKALKQISDGIDTQQQSKTSSAEDAVSSDPASKTSRFRDMFNLAKLANDHTTAQNAELHKTYGDALDTWYKTVDRVNKLRESAISEHTERELERKKRADEERVKRENLIQMHRHVQDMRRYAEISMMESEAKRRRMCNGTHEAESIVRRDTMVKPQLLVVRGHFRKARIQEPISDKHMENMRDALRQRWKHFMDGVIPSSSSLDNHGVKTWNTNFDAVMESIVIPFFQFRYNATPLIDRVYVQRKGPRVIFASYCDALMRELILNSDKGEYKHLMYLFVNADDQDAQQLVALSHNVEEN